MRAFDRGELHREGQEEREERYNRELQRRLASCGDRDYPASLARQDIIEREQERLRIMGVVDISEPLEE